MALKDILLLFLPSNEIKIRIKNKQIKINNEIVSDSNILFDIQAEIVEIEDKRYLQGYWELGDFLFLNEPFNLLSFVNVKDLFGSEPTNLYNLHFLTGYTLLSLSKKEHYVFITN